MSPHGQKEEYALYERHYSRVKAFVRSMVREDWIAEDLTQETFIRAFRNLPSLKDPSREKPWLFRIAKNICLDHFRQGNGADKKGAPLTDTVQIPAATACTESLMARQEMTACVQSHFQLLPEHLREVIWLFDVEGATHREIAEILEIEVSNVKVRLHRARKKMQEILNENCRFERDERNVFVCVPSKDRGL